MATTKKSATKSKAKAKTTRAATTKKSTTKKTAKRPVKKATKTASKSTARKSTTNKVTKKNTSNAKVTTVSSVLMPFKKLHVFFGLVMAVLAGLVYAYGNDVLTGIHSTYLVENTLTQDGSLLLGVTELFAVNLKHVAVGVLVAAAAWHAALATSLFGRYVAQIKAKFTSLNWIEHAVFGPWIIAIVAAVIGVRDIATLLLLASVPAATAVLGYLTDRYNLVGNATLLKQKIAIEMLLLPWIVIGISILHTYLYGFVTFDNLVYVLLAAGLVIYAGLGYVHKGQITATGRFADFNKAEKTVVSLQALLLVVLALVFFV